MPVPVTSEALGKIERRNKSKYGAKPSLYELLLSVAFEKSLFSGCQNYRTSCPVPYQKPIYQGYHCTMARDNTLIIPKRDLNELLTPVKSVSYNTQPTPQGQEPPLEWSWPLEHEDRKKEAKADSVHGAAPFQVDRKLLKDIVQEKMGAPVARIQYLGAGTFHKGYLITLVDRREVVARVARRFMPRLKTQSEVATMQYLRERTDIPVPTVYHFDANPYNRLGGEYILMSKAKGIPLGRVFHSMSYNELARLMENLAMIILPLFAHRFQKIGSIYLGTDPDPLPESTSCAPTPTVTSYLPKSLPMTPIGPQHFAHMTQYHVGPIISWPFFGSNRGELSHPTEMNRGPWPSTYSYLQSCVDREIQGVQLENEGKSAPHRLHLDPDEIIASRHHRVEALSGDVSDQSDEWDWEESEAEWDGPGNRMYQDYRRMQRSTFLIAHLKQREERVKAEMARFLRMMERLGVARREQGDIGEEEFAIDCHDLSLENVFVDEHDHSKITSVIDWESTTTRPLWAAAHVPAFLQTSPFTSKLFRATVEKIASQKQTVAVNGYRKDLGQIAREWLHFEETGARLRMAHRCVEWDGWEEGLVESILGPEDQEDDWFKCWEEAEQSGRASGKDTPQSPETSTSPTLTESEHDFDGEDGDRKISGSPLRGKGRAVAPLPVKVVEVEKEKEKLLKANGDICGGRGGELGRRLEAWLYVNGDSEGRVELSRRWEGDAEAIHV